MVIFCDVNCASEKSTRATQIEPPRERQQQQRQQKIRVAHDVNVPVPKGMADDQLIAEWQEIQREIASKVVEKNSDDFFSHKEYLTEIPPISFGAKEGDDDGHNNRFKYRPLNIDEGGHINDDSLYGGVDVSFGPLTTDDADQIHSRCTAVAVYVVLRRQQKQKNKHKRQPNSEILSDDYELAYSDSIHYTPNVPYMSGYLAIREIEPLQTMVQRQIEQKPECTPRVILVDGNGMLHPRKAGIACFLGVRTGVPTIGIGKNLCCVEHCWTVDGAEAAVALGLRDAVLATSARMAESDQVISDTRDVRFGKTKHSYDNCKDVPSMKESVDMLAATCRGYAVNLQASNGKILGAAVYGHGGRANGKHGKRTSNPIYVSVGHNISLGESIVLCTKLCNSRIPEPVRVADLLGRKLMRESETNAVYRVISRESRHPLRDVS